MWLERLRRLTGEEKREGDASLVGDKNPPAATTVVQVEESGIPLSRVPVRNVPGVGRSFILDFTVSKEERYLP